MIELIIAIALIGLVFFYFKKIKNKKSSTAPADTIKPVTQENKPVNTIETPAESPVTTPKPAKPESVISQVVEPVTPPVVTPTTPKVEKAPQPINKNLPEDSTLRRHYLTHLRAIVASINPAHPTDSALSRHYDTEITAQLEQAISSKVNIEQLLACYEQYKKAHTVVVEDVQPVVEVQAVTDEVQAAVETQAVVEEAQPVVEETDNEITASPEPETHNESVVVSSAEHKASKIPEDSQLRRHYITHIYAQVEAGLPPRPTDSTLRRHHDCLLENEVKSRLAAHG
jgi:hypothetical protein